MLSFLHFCLFQRRQRHRSAFDFRFSFSPLMPLCFQYFMFD
jgi:hypothetical protein